jgi:hypothetical protein
MIGTLFAAIKVGAKGLLTGKKEEVRKKDFCQCLKIRRLFPTIPRSLFGWT